MNLQDPDGIIHQPDGGLTYGNEAFQTLLDSGFNVNVASRCNANLTVAKMVEASVTCISCLAAPVPQAVKPWVQRPIRTEKESPERLITGPDGIVHASRTYWAVEALTLCGVRLPNHGAGRKVKSPTCIGCLAA